MTLLSNFKTLLLSFQAIVRPPFTPFSSSSSYPAARFSSPKSTPLSLVLHHQLHQGISCSTCRFISSPIITTSQSSRTTKDFNILYFKHCNTSLCSLEELCERDVTRIVGMLIWHVWCVQKWWRSVVYRAVKYKHFILVILAVNTNIQICLPGTQCLHQTSWLWGPWMGAQACHGIYCHDQHLIPRFLWFYFCVVCDLLVKHFGQCLLCSWNKLVPTCHLSPGWRRRISSRRPACCL